MYSLARNHVNGPTQEHVFVKMTDRAIDSLKFLASFLGVVEPPSPPSSS